MTPTPGAWATPTAYPTASVLAPFNLGDNQETITTFAEHGVATWNMGNQQGFVDAAWGVLIILLTAIMLRTLIKQIRDF